MNRESLFRTVIRSPDLVLLSWLFIEMSHHRETMSMELVCEALSYLGRYRARQIYPFPRHVVLAKLGPPGATQPHVALPAMPLNSCMAGSEPICMYYKNGELSLAFLHSSLLHITKSVHLQHLRARVCIADRLRRLFTFQDFCSSIYQRLLSSRRVPYIYNPSEPIPANQNPRSSYTQLALPTATYQKPSPPTPNHPLNH